MNVFAEKFILKKLALEMIVLCGLIGCGSNPVGNSVTFVDRSEIYPVEQPDPLLLIVEIGYDGTLRLNKIDAGTTADISRISENLRTIFAERARVGIERRDVVIEMMGEISLEDLELVVDAVKLSGAETVKVIKNGKKGVEKKSL
ncbi:MAG: hypothetical protein WBD22_03880 [Pyrinomonadaceae bacterium]